MHESESKIENQKSKMETRILYLFTRTPLHVGAGSSVGAIDQPIIRERHTGFPVIPGSALKGVLADGESFLKKNGQGKWERTELGRNIFGDERTEGENARSGTVSFGEAKLLAFPVRSARGCFAWLTSPLTLRRWQRDTSNSDLPDLPLPSRDEACFTDALEHDQRAMFEDYVFRKHKTAFPKEWLDKLSQVQPDAETVWCKLCLFHLALVSDESLSLFARTACEVAQHVRIDDETGTAADRALFNQENVPAETLFYAPLTELRANALNELSMPNVIQVGGDGTTGLGYLSTHLA